MAAVRPGLAKLVASGLVAGVLGTSSFAQQAPPKGEWRTYGSDLASTRYSPLDQITAANFNTLEVAWRFKTDNLGPDARVQLPVHAADGRRRALHDRRHRAAPWWRSTPRPASSLWMHREDEGKRGEEAPRQLSGRGLVVLDRRPRRRASST